LDSKRVERSATSVLRPRTAFAAATARTLLPIVVAAVVLAVLPSLWFEHSTYTTGLVIKAMLFAAYGIGFNLIFGSTNQLFLCVGALASVAAYAAAILAERASLPIVAGVAVGTAIAAIVGGLLSWISVRRRLQVIFTGIVTLVFSLAFQNLLLGRRDLTGGDTGKIVTGAAVRFADTRLAGYYLFAGLVVAFLIVFRLLQVSHVGWAFRALRDDEVAAVLAGVAVARYRIYAAVVGSAMIGLTGALYAYSDGFISPATYAFDQIDIPVLVLVAFGGLGTLLGPLVGAAVFEYLDQALSTSGQVRDALYGGFIVILFLGFRRGFVPTLASLPAKLVRGGRREEEWRPLLRIAAALRPAGKDR
jgi:branched-chain amino acid transport system permease protein